MKVFRSSCIGDAVGSVSAGWTVFWASRKFKHKDALIDFSTFPGPLSTSTYGLCAFSSAGMQPLFLRKPSAPLFCSSRHAFRLPVQAAHCWREQSSNPGEDTCDTRKANDHVRSEVLEKESAHQCSKWSRSSCQGKTCPKNLPSHGGLDQPLQQRSFYREIRCPGTRAQSKTQERKGQRMKHHQRTKESSPQDGNQRLRDSWPDSCGNNTSAERSDQCSHSETCPEQAISLGTRMENPVTVERQRCFQRAI